MKLTLKEIVERVGGRLVGNPQWTIEGVAGIEEAQENEITFVGNPQYKPLISITKAGAIVVSQDLDISLYNGKNFILTENPSLLFSQIIDIFKPSTRKVILGIHPTAIIGKNVKLGNNLAIGPYVVIEDNVEIGDNTVIRGHCFIGYDTKIGRDCLIYPNVTILDETQIGDRVIIHAGTVIGSDGFGYVKVNGVHKKIPQVGSVLIEDDVEIGANVTIDRARFKNTIIGKGTKIDNLVQIAHNVVIGKNCIIVAQAGISGSTVLEDNVILAGQVGIVGHIRLGEGVIVGAKSGVSKSIPAKTVVFGYPAKPMDVAKKINACIQRLPKLYETVKKIEEEVFKYGKTEDNKE